MSLLISRTLNADGGKYYEILINEQVRVDVFLEMCYTYIYNNIVFHFCLR